MSQTWNFPMAGSSSISAGRTVINDGVESLRTLHSGTTAPSSTVAYMLWADTTATLLKMRDSGDSAWLTLGTLAANLGHLRADGSNAMTGNLDLNGNDLILDADGDCTIDESADDIIDFKVGPTPTTVLTMDGTLGGGSSPGIKINGNKLYVTDDDASFIDGATTDVIGFSTNSLGRFQVNNDGLRVDQSGSDAATVKIEDDNTGLAGLSGYFTLTGYDGDVTTGGTQPTLKSTTPTGGSGGDNKWLQIYDGGGTVGWIAFWN
jgi:hypothetical protein